MATRSTEAVPISGRVDRAGRLIAADLAFERLQVEAGSALGQALALPQIAALARAAASLGVRCRARWLPQTAITTSICSSAPNLPRASDGDILLTIERWVARPMAGTRLALVADADADDERRASDAATLEFETDAALNLVEISPALASRLGVDAERRAWSAADQPVPAGRGRGWRDAADRRAGDARAGRRAASDGGGGERR